MTRRLILSLATAMMFAVVGAHAATTPATPAKATPAATVAAPGKSATPVAAATPAKPVKTTTRCRDAKGKFVACPKTVAAKTKPAPCRDSKGKFIACATK